MVGGSWSTQREPMHKWGEHANSTQKGPRWGLNLEPSRCEVTVLTTTPPCSPVVSILVQFYSILFSDICLLTHSILTYMAFQTKKEPSVRDLWPIICHPWSGDTIKDGGTRSCSCKTDEKVHVLWDLCSVAGLFSTLIIQQNKTVTQRSFFKPVIFKSWCFDYFTGNKQRHGLRHETSFHPAKYWSQHRPQSLAPCDALFKDTFMKENAGVGSFFSFFFLQHHMLFIFEN